MVKNDFGDNPERAQRIAEETAWENSRREILQRFGLWEEYGPEEDTD